MATASAEAPTRASPPLFPPTLGKRKITIIPTGCILIIHRPISMLALTPLREQMSITHTPAIRAAATVPILSITILLVLLTGWGMKDRSEEHTSELQSLRHLVCRLLLEKK